MAAQHTMRRKLVTAFALTTLLSCSSRPEENIHERCIPPGTCADISTEFKVLEGDSQRGRALFLENCATCHGQDAKGIPAKSSQDLTDPIWQDKTKDGQIRNVIRIGQGMKMPSFPLGQQQLADLVSFIRAQNQSNKSP